MSTIFQILQNTVKRTRKNHHIKSDNEAFIQLCLSVILKLSDSQIGHAITHGEKDGGIDAIHLDDKGIHILVCDYTDKTHQARRPFSMKKIREFNQTWLSIVGNDIKEGKVNEALWLKILEMKQYWRQVKDSDIPHTFYFITNKENAPIEHAWIEKQLNYNMTHDYCYLGQEEIARATAASGWNWQEIPEKSTFEQALDLEEIDPVRALIIYEQLDRENVHYYTDLLPVAIIGPVMAVIVASFVAPLFGAYRDLVTFLIMFSGYFPIVVLFMRREIKKGFKPARPWWWLLSISIFFLGLLYGEVIILLFALAIAAILSCAVQLPFLLMFFILGIAWPVWLVSIISMITFIFGLAFVFSDVYHPFPPLIYLIADIFAGVKRNRRDIGMFFIKLTTSASIVGSGAFGLLYTYCYESIGFALFAGILFGLGYHSYTGKEPFLDNLNRLGQTRCFLRLGQFANAYYRLREVSRSPEFARPTAIKELVNALEILGGRYHTAYQNQENMVSKYLIKAQEAATTLKSPNELIRASINKSWKLAVPEL